MGIAEDREKENAAKEALKLVENRMVLGLGTGSNARLFVKLLADRAKLDKLSLTCVCTSLDTRMMAISLGLKVAELDQVSRIDLAVDGADMITEKLHCIKGGKGALAREKVVDYMAKEFVVIAERKKLVDRLSGDVPIEVMPFAYSSVMRDLAARKIHCTLRQGVAKFGPLVTDNNNYLIDARIDIEDAEKMEKELNDIPGVVANGIFTKVTKAIVGTGDGTRTIVHYAKAYERRPMPNTITRRMRVYNL